MAVGRVTAGILPLAKRGEERAGVGRVSSDPHDPLVGIRASYFVLLYRPMKLDF